MLIHGANPLVQSHLFDLSHPSAIDSTQVNFFSALGLALGSLFKEAFSASRVMKVF